jgi:hypothetical protein
MRMYATHLILVYERLLNGLMVTNSQTYIGIPLLRTSVHPQVWPGILPELTLLCKEGGGEIIQVEQNHKLYRLRPPTSPSTIGAFAVRKYGASV